MVASLYGHSEVGVVLLEHGATVNLQDDVILKFCCCFFSINL